MTENKETIYQSFVHEIINIIPILNKSSDIIIDGVSDKGKVDIQGLEYHSQIIKDAVELINLNAAILNLELNPDFYTYQQKQYIDLLPIFKRAAKIFKLKSSNRKINLVINGEELPKAHAFPIIKIIPYILLDNCIKYSPSSQAIDIEYSVIGKSCLITINSLGPYVPISEIPKLTQKFYRGENSVNSEIEGKGLGLYILDKLCTMNNIKFEFTSKDTNFKYNGINYATITQTLEIVK